MKPLFLDCPPRYTRTQRGEADDVGYACSVHGVRSAGYSRAWWIAMALICLATLGVLL